MYIEPDGRDIQSNSRQSLATYSKAGDGTNDRGILGRGEGLVGGADEPFGSRLRRAGGLDVDDAFGRHGVLVLSAAVCVDEEGKSNENRAFNGKEQKKIKQMM